MLKALFIALQLMTRIPAPVMFHINDQDSEKYFGWSVLFYPVVGLLIGGLLILISWCLFFLNLPQSGLIEAAIILTFWVLLTGALHLDGLADSADAWLGGYGDKQRTLEIMKDPYSGPAAVVILVLTLLLKFSALIEIKWQVLLLTPVLARTAVMILFASTKYVRAEGMGEAAVNNLPKRGVWFVVVMVLSISVLLLGKSGWGLLILFVIGYLLRRLMIKRIGGTTGDTAGAMLEIMEVTTMIVFILLVNIS